MEAPMKATTLSISLPQELARFIREKVEAGTYSSASEVIREALRLLMAGQPESIEFDIAEAEEAILGFRQGRIGIRLGDDLTLRDLIDEGRR
jgi:antitoxin ParD1/3/4